MASFKARIEIFLDADCEDEARTAVSETMQTLFREICPFTSLMIGWRFCDDDQRSHPDETRSADSRVRSIPINEIDGAANVATAS